MRAGAVAALVAALGLELEPVDLLAELVARHDGLDLHLAELTAVEHGLVAVGEQQRLEVDLVALLGAHPIDEDRLPLLNAVLLPAHSDYRVAHRQRTSLATQAPRVRQRPGPRRSPPRSRRPSRSAAAAKDDSSS